MELSYNKLQLQHYISEGDSRSVFSYLLTVKILDSIPSLEELEAYYNKEVNYSKPLSELVGKVALLNSVLRTIICTDLYDDSLNKIELIEFIDNQSSHFNLNTIKPLLHFNLNLLRLLILHSRNRPDFFESFLPIISEDPSSSLSYCTFHLKKRFLEGEVSILKDKSCREAYMNFLKTINL